MVGRIVGLLLVLWSGGIFARTALRGLASHAQGSAPYGHEGAYATGYAAGQVLALIFAVFMMLGGLYLLFARSYGPNPRSRKKAKRRKIVTPTGFKD